MTVYEFKNGSWEKLGESIYGESNDDYAGYSVSMNEVGNRVAVGAIYSESLGGDNNGSVTVYELKNDEWEKLGEPIYGESNDDEAGYSVSINAVGNRVAIGARYANNDDGSVTVYELKINTWEKVGEPIYDGSIISMNSAGNVVAVGKTTRVDTVGGSVSIYEELKTGEWGKLGDTIYSPENTNIGSSVSLNKSGTRVVIGGAYTDYGNVDTDNGIVVVYDYNNIKNEWVKLGNTLLSVGLLKSDQFGESVSINANGDRIIGGSRFGDLTSNDDKGFASVYQLKRKFI